MKALEEISAEVYAELYVNGRKVDAQEIVVGLSRLIQAATPFLPALHIDDTPEQKRLRHALSIVNGINGVEA